MNTRTVSFARHLHESLSPYRFAVALAASVTLAFVFLFFSLSARTASDRQVLRAVSPYLSSLVESQDRPELLRVLTSVSQSRTSEMALVQNGSVLASTRNISEMDQQFSVPETRFSIFGSSFTKSDIMTALAITHEGGLNPNATIYLFTPLRETLLSALSISATALMFSLIVSFLSARRMKRAVKTALQPLEQLHKEIQLIAEDGGAQSQPIPIRELEEIRQTISKAKHDLANVRERLSEERAKQLNAESYKRLIHDLHNPVAALRGQLRLIADPSTDDETRNEAVVAVPRIADQILNQVGAAKRNLGNDAEALRDGDLRTCVRESVHQVRTILGSSSEKEVLLSLPTAPVVAAHDPILLQRAVVNLLENGLEAGRERVEIVLEKVGNQIFIRVSDDGQGLDESQLSIYLQGRGESSKANRPAFGLASVNHIVRSHGGKIVYKRSDMGGASFEIRLGAV